MFLLDGTIVYSAADLTDAAGCEFALLRRLDEKLGRIPPRGVSEDPLLVRTATLGDAHELRELQRLRRSYDVHEVQQPDLTREALEAAGVETTDALRSGVDVVYQAAFFDGRFQGYADFLIRDRDSAAYAVWDTKLARHAKVPALLQLAAYADQLARANVPVSLDAHLRLGDNRASTHPIAELVPVYRERRRRLQLLLDDHLAAKSAVEWNDPRYTACGRCDTCAAEVEQHRDLLLVARLRLAQRKKLRAGGIESIDALAGSTGGVTDLSTRTLETLRAQARLQVRQHPPPPAPASDEVLYDVFDSALLTALPAPDDGDVFFDFEGDPLWAGDRPDDWGLEYLFGVLETDERFRPFWAHDRPAEKRALEEFIAYVEDRRRKHPGLHVYHYAAYEKSALLRLAGRHGTGEEVIDSWLRSGLLVDLYATVRGSLRVSQRSYSIKKLEPLYMGDRLRSADVTTAGDSIVEYQAFRTARESDDTAAADQLLAHIGDYNEYDCLSTLRLRNWLLERAAECGGAARRPDASGAAPETSVETADSGRVELAEKLTAFAGDGQRDDNQQAAAMVAASLGYHRRENKPFWWSYFDRLRVPVDEWGDVRDVLVPDEVCAVSSWEMPPGKRLLRRTLRLTGMLETGSALGPESTAYCLYDPPVPDGLEPPEGAVRAVNRSSTKVTTCETGADGRDVVLLEEGLPKNMGAYDALPMAICGASPPPTTSLETAVHELAGQVAADLPGLRAQPGIDILRRRPPRTTDGAPLARPVAGTTDYAEPIVAALRRIEDSYLAVQGPPGTGKTHVGAHVIAALVADGWRIGVVAQSHKVVEHLLTKVLEVGVAGAQVAKMEHGDRGDAWTSTPGAKYAAFLEEHRSTGCVVGGTAWTFSNGSQVPRGCLDLLVVDEAGQFSLANTLAVSVAARRLLLLGDPQQLPQVSKGRHPEPVDVSALEWLTEGRDTLPVERGYFLERTWRMHPALCEPVSQLSYDGRLRSQEGITATRSLAGVPPGIAVVDVAHRGNSVESAEEAVEVVAQVRDLLGRAWSRSVGEAPRPLAQHDFLVVAPFNAQVAIIGQHLASAGFGDVPVGTVDRFQGQEAPVVIVSMAVSTADDVPRGMEFVLSRNRLNVAVSRGQWRAVLVRSDALTDFLPATPEGLVELGAFVRLCEP